MAASKLSSTTVDRLPYKPSSARWVVYWHQKLSGFGLRVTERGVRTYVVRYRLRGSRAQRLRAIGKTSTYTFGEAQRIAGDVLKHAGEGIDYFDSLKRQRSQTLGEVWRYYESEHLASEAVSAQTRGNAKSLWTSHCAKEFDFCSLADITGERARDWHRRITKNGSYVANRAMQALRAAWNYGLRYDRIPRELSNPFADVTRNKEQARQTILEPTQFPRFAAAMNSVSDPIARAYLWMLFYTGCRRTELLKLQWKDVEIKRAVTGELRSGAIMLRETKGGTPRTVALSEPAVLILESLPLTDNPHVFFGSIKGTHLDPKKPWDQVRTEANLPELRLHDLRRSFGSWLGATGFSPKQIGALLGHKTDITSRVYVQLGEAVNLKRQLVVAHAKLADEFLLERPKAEVHDIETGAKL
jgi:integrase